MTLRDVYVWFVQSAADPEKVALTVKGLLVSASGVIILLAALLGHQVLPEQITAFAVAVSNVIDYGLLFFGALVSLVGFIRKVILTLKNKQV